MKYFFVGLFFILSHSLSFAQLYLEGIATTGMNATIYTPNFALESPFKNSSQKTHFAGPNLGANLGVRLFILDQEWSIGASFGYSFRYHEAFNKFFVGQVPNDIYSTHFLVLPLDFNYNLKNKVGFHFGFELSWFINEIPPNLIVQPRRKVIISPLIGISYTHKRLRFELLYKHNIQDYLTKNYYYKATGIPGPSVDYKHYRFHDIELRLAIRLFKIYD